MCVGRLVYCCWYFDLNSFCVIEVILAGEYLGYGVNWIGWLALGWKSKQIESKDVGC